MGFKTGDKVVVTQSYTSTDYGPVLFLSQGQKLSLVAQGPLGDWIVESEGVRLSKMVPEAVLAPLSSGEVREQVKAVINNDGVYYLAYDEKGQKISIEIPEDRLDLDGYKVTVMEG